MQLIGRIFLLLGGLVFFLEATLPLANHQEVVNGRATQNGKYTLSFTGELVTRCNVGFVAFNALSDGENISLSTTPILGQCTQIVKGDGTILTVRSNRWYLAILGLALLAGGLGWLRSDAGTIILFRR